jgi:hypothetical protein
MKIEGKGRTEKGVILRSNSTLSVFSSVVTRFFGEISLCGVPSVSLLDSRQLGY